jgi:hypothetical protein
VHDSFNYDYFCLLYNAMAATLYFLFESVGSFVSPGAFKYFLVPSPRLSDIGDTSSLASGEFFVVLNLGFYL